MSVYYNALEEETNIVSLDTGRHPSVDPRNLSVDPATAIAAVKECSVRSTMVQSQQHELVDLTLS